MADDTDADLSASTGKNDSGSVWGTLLGQLPQWATVGTNLYRTVSGGSTPAASAPASAPAPAGQPSSFAKYLPWIGGGIALLVLVFIFKRK